MAEEHMKDYVWMQPPDKDAPPEKVKTDSLVLTQKMVAGWLQCDPPKEKVEEKPHVHQ